MASRGASGSSGFGGLRPRSSSRSLPTPSRPISPSCPAPASAVASLEAAHILPRWQSAGLDPHHLDIRLIQSLTEDWNKQPPAHRGRAGRRGRASPRARARRPHRVPRRSRDLKVGTHRTGRQRRFQEPQPDQAREAGPAPGPQAPRRQGRRRHRPVRPARSGAGRRRHRPAHGPQYRAVPRRPRPARRLRRAASCRRRTACCR